MMPLTGPSLVSDDRYVVDQNGVAINRECQRVAVQCFRFEAVNQIFGSQFAGDHMVAQDIAQRLGVPQQFVKLVGRHGIKGFVCRGEDRERTIASQHVEQVGGLQGGKQFAESFALRHSPADGAAAPRGLEGCDDHFIVHHNRHVVAGIFERPDKAHVFVQHGIELIRDFLQIQIDHDVGIDAVHEWGVADHLTGFAAIVGIDGDPAGTIDGRAGNDNFAIDYILIDDQDIGRILGEDCGRNQKQQECRKYNTYRFYSMHVTLLQLMTTMNKNV